MLIRRVLFHINILRILGVFIVSEHVLVTGIVMNDNDDECTAIFQFKKNFREFVSGTSSVSSVVSKLSFEGKLVLVLFVLWFFLFDMLS